MFISSCKIGQISGLGYFCYLSRLFPDLCIPLSDSPKLHTPALQGMERREVYRLTTQTFYPQIPILIIRQGLPRSMAVVWIFPENLSLLVGALQPASFADCHLAILCYLRLELRTAVAIAIIKIVPFTTFCQ